MYPLKASTAITVPFFAHDVNGDGVTGLVDGEFTKRISKDGGAFAAMTVTVTELENGWYSIPVSSLHSDTLGLLTLSLSHASMKRVNMQFRVHARILDDLASPTNITAATGIVLSGVTHTDAVIPTVSAVTGLTAANLDATISSRMATYTQPTGFLAATFPTGTIANTTNITAGTLTTVTTATNVTTVNGMAASVITAASIATDAIQAAKIQAAALNGKGDWNIGKTGYALTATTGLGNQTANITGTITTATNVTTLNGIAANVITAASIAAAALNGKGDWNIGKTGYALSAAGVQAVWDALTSALTTVNTIGKLLVDNLNATISSRMATYTQPTGFLAATFPGTVASPTNITAGTLTTVTTATNVTTLNGMAANVITAASINADAITAAKIADGAIDSATFAVETGLRPIRSGTAQAGAATTITLDASASSVDSFYNNTMVLLTGGAGVGQSRFISAYVGATKVATVATWGTNPDVTSTFAILPFDAVAGASAPTAAQNATAVWDRARASHVTAGTFGEGAASVQGNITGSVATATNVTTVNGLAANVITAASIAAAALNGKGNWNIGKTGYALSAPGVQAVWNVLTSALTTVNTIGKLLVDNLDATISSRMATYTQPTGFLAATFPGTVASPTNITAGTLTTVTTATNVTTLNGMAANVITAASIATDAIGAAQLAADAVTEIQAGLATPAQVNAEVVDALNVDTYGEPGQATPAATATLAGKIGFLYKAWRNRTTQSASQYSLYNDDATTLAQKATFSDDGTTADRGEVGTGP